MSCEQGLKIGVNIRNQNPLSIIHCTGCAHIGKGSTAVFKCCSLEMSAYMFQWPAKVFGRESFFTVAFLLYYTVLYFL